MKQPVVNTDHEVSFVRLASDFYPQALNLTIAAFQSQLCTVNPLLHVQGTRLPLLPCLSLLNIL